MHSMVKTVVPLIGVMGALTLSGCAFSPGDPWGLLEPTLEVSLALGEGRLDGEGRLITAEDYAVTLTSLQVVIGPLEFAMAAGGGDVAFDPAAPPEGYSLCHGGHCHADDGRLVPYAEIAASLGADTATLAVTSAPVDPTVSLPVDGAFGLVSAETPTAVPLGDCSPDCLLEQGSLGAMTLPLVAIVAQGRVFDRRVGEAARLPEEGVALDAIWPVSLRLTTPLDAPLDEDHAPGLNTRITLSIPGSFLDTTDFAAALSATDPPTIDAAVSTPTVAESLAPLAARVRIKRVDL